MFLSLNDDFPDFLISNLLDIIYYLNNKLFILEPSPIGKCPGTGLVCQCKNWCLNSSIFTSCTE